MHQFRVYYASLIAPLVSFDQSLVHCRINVYIVIALRSDCDSNLTFAQLESCIRSAMKVSRLHTNQIVHIRVYYKHSPAVCLFLKGILSYFFTFLFTDCPSLQ